MSSVGLTISAAFVWLLGLCVGSFLNVVIYRLPRGLSLNKPVRSFCPRCRAGIAWYDNLPLLGWLLLRGRCRHCRGAISAQYPVIEALTGLLFCLTFYLLFVADARQGLQHATLPRDVAVLAAWLVLVATLIVCTATDLVSYTIDVRVTNAAMLGGVLLGAAGLRSDFVAPAVAGPGGLVAAAVAVASVVALYLTIWRGTDDDSAASDDQEQAAAEPGAARPLLGVLVALLFVALVVWLLVTTALVPNARTWAQVLPVPVIFCAAFAAIVIAAGEERAADDELEAALDAEEPLARRVALAELRWLAPLVAVGVLVGILSNWPVVTNAWAAAVAWTPAAGVAPLGGLAFALHGAVWGALAGWLLRIVFTLVFGREAFGVGDIYILAAAGACAGWDIALLGLAMSVGLALAGWVFGLLLKRTIMIPFGPWLALGFLLALWLNVPAADVARHYADNVRAAWENRPDLLLIAGGVMLVGGVGAVVLAKGVRRLIEQRLA